MATTPSITFSNFTGVDFNQILQAVIAAGQVPIANLNSSISSENLAISTLGTISGDLTTLQNSLSAINTGVTIPTVSATVSQNAPVAATAQAGAPTGSYQVSVNQVATGATVASQGYSSSDAVIGTGSISVNVGGTLHTISVDSTNDTLAGVAGAINAAGIGVSAYVLDTGLPGAPYRLAVASTATGALQTLSISDSLSGGISPDFANASISSTVAKTVTGTSTPTVGGSYTGAISQGFHFTVNSNATVGTDATSISYVSDSGQSGTIAVPSGYAPGTPLAVADGLTLSLSAGTLKAGDTFSVSAFQPTIQNAQDAVLQINGQIVTSASNSINGAIPGVSLSVTGTGGPATVTVAGDSSGASSQIQAFANAYNQVVKDITSATQGTPGQTQPALSADGGVRSTLFNLQLALGSSNLSNLGLSVDQKTGLLSFDSNKLATAQSANPSAVTQALQSLYKAASVPVNGALTAKTGVIASDTAAYQAEVTSDQAHVTQMTTQLQNEQTQLQAQYGQIQALVASYQNISQLFSTSSSNSSTGLAPGSNLTLSG